MPAVPALMSHEGSWVIVDRATGKAVMETYRQSTAERVNQERYEVVTVHTWLARLNKRAK